MTLLIKDIVKGIDENNEFCTTQWKTARDNDYKRFDFNIKAFMKIIQFTRSDTIPVIMRRYSILRNSIRISRRRYINGDATPSRIYITIKVQPMPFAMGASL